MKRRVCLGLALAWGLGSIVGAGTVASAQDWWDNALHNTRAGKSYWYSAENGGFEAFTGVPIADIGCIECHGPTDATGAEYPADYQPNCVDCHDTSQAEWPVAEDQCYSCHGRQKTEAFTLGYSDVHRDMGMKCWECHSWDDLHNDGTPYQSMLEPGAVDADCTDCHDSLPGGHATYDPHGGVIHCASCHAQTVITCYNCHFESQVEAHVKRAKQPLSDFVMLVNRTKDGKVYPASFQSLSYQGHAFTAFGPYSAHTITREGARTCTDCHYNMGGGVDAIQQYNDNGIIRFAEWDDDTDELSWTHGVIPIPEDYAITLRMDFITYDGDPSDPAGPSPNWSSIGKDLWDGSQLFFATPLTRDQMDKLGFAELCHPDFNDDGFVDVADLLELLAAWGTDPIGPPDIDGNRNVGVEDLLAVLAAWGTCPS